jgi:hypothetical protein
MEFEPTTPVFEWAKTFHALDRATIVNGVMRLLAPLIASDEETWSTAYWVAEENTCIS